MKREAPLGAVESSRQVVPVTDNVGMNATFASLYIVIRQYGPTLALVNAATVTLFNYIILNRVVARAVNGRYPTFELSTPRALHVSFI